MTHVEVVYGPLLAAGVIVRERAVWVYYQAMPAAMQAITRLFATAGMAC